MGRAGSARDPISSCRCESSAEYSAASSWRGSARREPRAELQFATDAFEQAVSAAVRTDWVVYAKRPFGGPEAVLKYLARYTHRVAISNSRLLDFEEGVVRFRYKDYAHGNRKRVLRLSAVEFVRRLLLHVLPTGFRGFAITASWSNRQRRAKIWPCAAELLSYGNGRPMPRRRNRPGKLARAPHRSLPTRVCPNCGAGRMIVLREFPPRLPARPDRSERGERRVCGGRQFVTGRGTKLQELMPANDRRERRAGQSPGREGKNQAKWTVKMGRSAGPEKSASGGKMAAAKCVTDPEETGLNARAGIGRAIQIPKGECPPRSGTVQRDCIRQAVIGLGSKPSRYTGPPDTTFFISVADIQDRQLCQGHPPRLAAARAGNRGKSASRSRSRRG